jgi:hypothetical protein
MNKYWLIPLTLLIVAAVGIGAYFFTKNSSETPDHAGVHYHAGFQIYVDDALQNFSDFQFMELKPCGPDDITDEDTVHLHGGRGDVVHVHHAGMTWANLGQYLVERSGANLSEDDLQKTAVEAYVNGQKVDDIMSYPIKAYDSVVVFIGKTTDIEGKLKNAVTVDYIKEAEKDKENCGV